MNAANNGGRTNLTFSDGVKAALPVIIGYLPAGITFGILARDAGIYLADVIGFSGIVFAGASQYMAVNLLSSGATYVEIVIATFLLNFRHFLMSASLSQRVQERRPWALAALGYGVTDETFAVAASERRALSTPYLAGLELCSWLAWNIGSLVGFVAGSYIPARIESAMGVALYALFAGLLFPQLKSNIGLIPIAICAGLMHWALLNIEHLSRGWAFVVAVAGSGLLGAVFIGIVEKKKAQA